MSDSDVRSGTGFGFGLFTLFVMAIFIGLGIWQLQRRVEKHALIAALDARLADAPVPLPPPAQWKTLTPSVDEFRRVTFSATFEPRPDVMVFTSGSAIRADVKGPGTWAFLPARLPDGDVIVVNAGLVENPRQDRAQQDKAVSKLIAGAPLTMTGYLRFPEKAGMLTPKANTVQRLWFARDIGAMATALGWAPDGRIAPFYVDLESPVPDNGIPKPGPLEVHLKDDHMQYAITWFGLAGAVLIAFGVWWRGQRTRPRT